MGTIAGTITAAAFLILGVLCVILPKRVKDFAYTKQEYETEVDSKVYIILLRFFGLVGIVFAILMFVKIYA